MWPFKKKEVAPAQQNYRMELVERLERWRAVGEEFEYLGRRMVVSGHYRVAGGYPFNPYVEPCIHADYADNNGVIRTVFFSAAESQALMRAQPNTRINPTHEVGSG